MCDNNVDPFSRFQACRPLDNFMDYLADFMNPLTDFLDPSANFMDASAKLMDLSADLIDHTANFPDPWTIWWTPWPISWTFCRFDGPFNQFHVPLCRLYGVFCLFHGYWFHRPIYQISQTLSGSRPSTWNTYQISWIRWPYIMDPSANLMSLLVNFTSTPRSICRLLP